MDLLKYIVSSEDESPHCRLKNQEETKFLTAN